MLIIEDSEYGVLYLVPVKFGWYYELDEDYPHYIKLSKNKKEVVEYSREMPDEIWKVLRGF